MAVASTAIGVGLATATVAASVIGARAATTVAVALPTADRGPTIEPLAAETARASATVARDGTTEVPAIEPGSAIGRARTGTTPPRACR